jgi:hypothetical protein
LKTLFHNGHFYLSSNSFSEALLVEDGVILEIGSNTDLLSRIDSQTECIDLSGRTVVPGWHDSHMHLHMVGSGMQRVQLYGSTSIHEVITRTRKFIEDHHIAPGSIVSGMGWNQDYFTDENRLLNRCDLDQISTEHIIILSRACGHVLAANSSAIITAGVSAQTPQPDGGHFDVDDQGEPTGVFRENANGLIQRLQPSITVESMMKSLELAMDYAASMGITAVQTMDLNSENAPMMLEAYQKVLEKRPTLRVYQQCNFSTPDEIKAFAAQGHKTGSGNSWMKIGPVKLFVDGSLGARTALMRQPYADDPQTNGIQCLTQEQLDALTITANENDFQVTVHVIGDGAMEMVLNSYEKVISNGANPLRHAMIHCQITDLPLLQRFRALGVYAQVQPIFLHYDSHIVYQRVGTALANTSYAFGTMLKLGIPVSFGSDSPVEDMNPYENLYCAVTRRDLTESTPYNIVEAVSIADAIDAYTLSSAKVCFRENQLGRLQPGYLADFVVLDHDLFTIDSMKIKEVRPLMTVVNGQIVYRSKNS